MLLFSGGFAWLALRPSAWPDTTNPSAASGGGAATESAARGSAVPVVTLSESLSDGRIEAEIYLGDALGYRIELRRLDATGLAIPVGARPMLVLTMAGMHMNEIEPALEIAGQGAWRASGALPMAGRWVMSTGFGDEIAEVAFDAR